MRTVRFPIAGLMWAVVVAALGLAALRNASDIWAGATFLVTCGVLCLALVGIVCRTNESRAWWVGFALFGWGYLALAFWSPELAADDTPSESARSASGRTAPGRGRPAQRYSGRRVRGRCRRRAGRTFSPDRPLPFGPAGSSAGRSHFQHSVRPSKGTRPNPRCPAAGPASSSPAVVALASGDPRGFGFRPHRGCRRLPREIVTRILGRRHVFCDLRAARHHRPRCRERSGKAPTNLDRGRPFWCRLHGPRVRPFRRFGPAARSSDRPVAGLPPPLVSADCQRSLDLFSHRRRRERGASSKRLNNRSRCTLRKKNRSTTS